MPLQSFSILSNCSRLIHHCKTVYKVKILYDIDTFQRDDLNSRDLNEEMEQVLRALMYMIERNVPLKPIESNHFNYQVRKVKWDFLSKRKGLVFMKDKNTLHVHHDILELTVKYRKDKTKDQALKKYVTKSQEQTKLAQDDTNRFFGKEKDTDQDCHENKVSKQAYTSTRVVVDKQKDLDEMKSSSVPETSGGIVRFFRDENGRLCQVILPGQDDHNQRHLKRENVTNKSNQKERVFSTKVRRSPRLKKLPSVEKHAAQVSYQKNKHVEKKTGKNNTAECNSTSDDSTESETHIRQNKRSAIKSKHTKSKEETTEESESSDSEPVPKKMKLRGSQRQSNQDQDSFEMSNHSDNRKQSNLTAAQRHGKKVANNSNNSSCITESPRLSVSSPRVSTVHPVKRNNPATKRDNSRSNLLSPGNVIIPATTSNPRFLRSTTEQDEEISRIESLRTPQTMSVDRLRTAVNSRRDRHSVEQAEREESTKLQRLFEPTRPRDNQEKPKNAASRSWSDWLWGRKK